MHASNNLPGNNYTIFRRSECNLAAVVPAEQRRKEELIEASRGNKISSQLLAPKHPYLPIPALTFRYTGFTRYLPRYPQPRSSPPYLSSYLRGIVRDLSSIRIHYTRRVSSVPEADQRAGRSIDPRKTAASVHQGNSSEREHAFHARGPREAR